MPRQQKLNQLPLIGRVLLCLLAGVYLVYLVAFGKFLYTAVFVPSDTIIDYSLDTNSTAAIQHWTTASMSMATGVDSPNSIASDLNQGSSDINSNKATRQQGQPPANGNSSYPLSTVGKIFFTSASGQDMVCSGTAVASLNQSVVDTAGHCLYWNGNWVRNVIFCPLYHKGSTPHGCWAARDLEVPADWIKAKPNDLHHDMGMAIVYPNDQGKLTDVVGGAGWAYNQPANQSFTAYGYPAGRPYDGETMQTCKGSSSTTWQHGAGKVVSFPCGMTGGSSGGPWFIQSGSNWYLNGHNDFTSSIKSGHMFSPYYDDTWYALYQKAQQM